MVAAVIAFFILVIFFPDHEKKSSPKVIRMRRLQALGVSLFGFGCDAVIALTSLDYQKRRFIGNPNAPSYKDLPICFISFAFCSVSRILINPIFAALGRCVLSKEKYGDQFEARVQRFASQCWKLLFHLAATIVPIIILPGQKWWPPGFCENVSMTYENFPDVPNVRYMREFYMFELGYYLHAYVATLKQQNRANYVEMTIHHVVTIVLIVYSYFLNSVTRFGIQVFWVHDVCDIFVCSTRLLLDFNSIIPTAISYFILMGLWFFFRLIIYPFVLIPQIVYYGPHFWWTNDIFPGIYFMDVCLICLFIMHIIWFKELFGMAGVYFKTGKAKDSTDESKEDMAKLKATAKHDKKPEEEEKKQNEEKEQPQEVEEEKKTKKAKKTRKAKVN